VLRNTHRARLYLESHKLESNKLEANKLGSKL